MRLIDVVDVILAVAVVVVIVAYVRERARRCLRRRARALRWSVWSWLAGRPGVCPSNAFTRVIYGERGYPIRIDDGCTRDCEAVGSCWCGKVRCSS